MKKIITSFIILVFPLIIFGQNYSKNRIKELVENLTERSTDLEHENFNGSKFINEPYFSVVDSWTDIEIYEDENYVDNETHKVFLKIVSSAKIKDLVLMTESIYPNVRVYGFWALLKRNKMKLASEVLEKEFKRKKEKVFFESFGDVIPEYNATDLMHKLMKLENYSG